MPRPGVGNPGNSGGGRKSAYQERADAEFLWNIFLQKLSKEELTEILKGDHSIKDAWIAKAYAGNERFIQQIVHKLFPDKKEHTGSEGKPIELDVNLRNAIEKVYGSDEDEVSE